MAQKVADWHDKRKRDEEAVRAQAKRARLPAETAGGETVGGVANDKKRKAPTDAGAEAVKSSKKGGAKKERLQVFGAEPCIPPLERIIGMAVEYVKSKTDVLQGKLTGPTQYLEYAGILEITDSVSGERVNVKGTNVKRCSE